MTDNSDKTSDLSPDDLLCLAHENYIRQVNESGIPIWMLDMYQVQLMYEEVDKSASS